MNTWFLNQMTARTLAWLLIWCPVAATATDHFVRPLVAGGYGPGDGLTYNTAWNGLRTIDWTHVTAGETVYVCGTHTALYGSNLVVAASGTAGSPIVISGSCPDGSGTDKGGIFGVHVEISPAEWSGPDGNGMYHHPYPGCTGSFLLEAEAGFPLSPSHPGTRQRWARDDFANPFANFASWTPGSFDQDGCGGTIYYKPATPGTAPGTAYTGGNGPVQITNRSYVTLRDLALYSSMVQYTIDLHNADNIVIENNDIQWGSHNVTIWDDSDNGIIRNNRIHDSTGSGIYFLTGREDTNTTSNDGWLVQNNEIYNVSPQCQWCGVTSGDTGDRHSIGVQGGGNNNIFEFNHIHHSGGDGIVFYNWSAAMNGNAQRNNIIRYNYIHDVKDLNPLCKPSAPGEWDEPDPGFPVKCQMNFGIVMTGDALPANPDTITGNIVHHNVLARINGIALKTKSTQSLSGYTWRFLNNTIIDSGIGLEFTVYDGAVPPYRLGGAEFRNNIIYNSVNQHLRAYLLNAVPDTSAFGMSNNIYYPDGTGMFKFGHHPNNTVSSDFAGWDDNSHIVDAGSLTSDPLFVDPTTAGAFAWGGPPLVIPGDGNFQLPIASPALDSGAPFNLSPEPDADILGNPMAGTRDRGAYELPYADLRLSVSDSPDPVLLGQAVKYTTTVTNLGPITAMGVVATGTLPTCDVGTLLSGTSGSCDATVTAGSLTLPTQTMTAAGADVDLHTVNNSASVDAAVQAPDLLEAALAVSVSGTNLLINDRVANAGDGAAGAFVLRYYLSTNAAYEATDTLLCSRSVASLAAGASNPVRGTTQSSCAIPSATADKYNIIALMDAAGTVTESNEGNNVTTVTVSLADKTGRRHRGRR